MTDKGFTVQIWWDKVNATVPVTLGSLVAAAAAPGGAPSAAWLSALLAPQPRAAAPP